MYSEPDKTAFFSDLKNLLIEYLQVRLELTKASAFEKIARIVAYLLIGFVAALLFFFGLLFLSLFLADYLSELFASRLAGYASIALFYLVLFAIVVSSGNNWLGRKITNVIIRILFEQTQNLPSDENPQNQ